MKRRQEGNKVSSNDVLTIKLTRDGGVLCEFKPEYTYYFYGTDEEVDEGEYAVLQFDGLTLRTNLSGSVCMTEPLRKVFEVTDLPITLPPPPIYEDSLIFAYEMSHDFIKRVQIFSLLYIEGASLTEPTDPNWHYYALYKKTKEGPFFAGYCTSYSFLRCPEGVRMRLSQFLILPPFRRSGLGLSFYKALMRYWRSVQEVTVEDPNDDFSALRLRGDFELSQEVDFDTSLFSENQKGRLDCLKRYQRDPSSNETRLAIKRFLLKTRPDEFPELDRKAMLQEAFEAESTIYDRILRNIG